MKLQYHSKDFFLLRDYPQRPINRKMGSKILQEVATSIEQEDYERKVKACIASKTKIDNPTFLLLFSVQWGLDIDGWSKIKDGSIFDLPENVEFEEKEVKCTCICHNHNVAIIHFAPCCNNGISEKVIHLKLKQEVKSLNNGIFTIITNPDSSSGKFGRSIPIGKRPHIKKVKEESQDELWDSLMEEWHDVSLNMQEPHILPYLKSKFKIQRIHP